PIYLGPEPLGPGLTGEFLYRATRRRKAAVRDILLNGRILAGVGNIYANEALFLAGIRPQRRANVLKLRECAQLALKIRQTLNRAIRAGGTTLRDFQNAEGRPGYFQQSLNVYGRTGKPCPRCQCPVKMLRLGQRSAFYCAKCQA
ncbi:MAG: DNA-formamidopyrimidine glycosylase, partial [Gammaproteobacteria bacterium]|nr:DNA-formamidopyrimidine glycosylase [Gammaproteobacteria bacterium]